MATGWDPREEPSCGHRQKESLSVLTIPGQLSQAREAGP
jgi:hypothetical protein